jgi:hypothetical protein
MTCQQPKKSMIHLEFQPYTNKTQTTIPFHIMLLLTLRFCGWNPNACYGPPSVSHVVFPCTNCPQWPAQLG